MSRRFKPNQKRFDQFMFNGQIPFNPYSSNFNDLEKLQNEMTEISNKLAQPIKDNYFLDEAIKTLNSIIVLGVGSSILKPYYDKLKTWLVSTNLYIKKLEQFKKIIDANKSLSNLSNKNLKPLLKNTGALKTELPKLSFAMKTLNVIFIVQSLVEIKQNLDKIAELEKKVDKSSFESKEEQINNLNSKIQFIVLRLVNSVASFIPGAFAITTAVDGLLMLFNPDNLENLGFVIEGFAGGKDEARKVWIESEKGAFGREVKDFTEALNAINNSLNEVTDLKVKEIIKKVAVVVLSNAKYNRLRFNDFATELYTYFPNEYKKYNEWLNKPLSGIVIQNIIITINKYKNENIKLRRQKIQIELDRILDVLEKNTNKSKVEVLLKRYQDLSYEYENLGK